MRLSEKLRPQRISEIIGQPVTAVLSAWLQDPYACSWLLEGPPGTGKTSAANCIVNELNVDADTDVHMIGCANLTADTVRRLMASVRCKPMFSQWRVIIFEEFEQLTQTVQMALKVDLDPINLPPHLITIATSNDVSKIPKAVQQRFQRLRFDGGNDFARLAAAQIRHEWISRTQMNLPPGCQDWGWDGNKFSLRAAWDKMEMAMLLIRAGAC